MLTPVFEKPVQVSMYVSSQEELVLQFFLFHLLLLFVYYYFPEITFWQTRFLFSIKKTQKRREENNPNQENKRSIGFSLRNLHAQKSLTATFHGTLAGVLNVGTPR